MLRRWIRNLVTINSSVLSEYSLKGIKEKQEDAYYCSPSFGNRRLIIVADGVGGHGNGEFASSLCIKVFRDEFLDLRPGFDPKSFLRETALLAAERILDLSHSEPSFSGFGTTLTGFLIANNKLFTINIGDSRVYHYREQNLTQLTEDHSLVQKMLAEGLITETEAKTHPKRHIMTSALGQPLEMITISIEGPMELKKKDILIACTDGVHEFVPPEIIKAIIMGSSPSDYSRLLVESAVRAQSNDNLTCCTLII